MKRITFRVAAAVAIGALAIGLAGCGTAKGGAADGKPALSKDPVTIRMYWWGGDARHERTKQVIALFEKKYPNITVKPEFADWNGYWEKLATSTAGKNMPDVVQMDAQYLAEYSNRGALADLSKLDVNLSGMEASVRGTGQVDGKQYAAPISTSSMAVIVNTDLLAKVGVPLPADTDTWTWGEFNTWAAQVSKASSGAAYGSQLDADIVQLQLFARQSGEQLFKDGKVVVSPKTVAAYFQTNLDRISSGAAAGASVFAETAGLPLDQLPISTGKAATQIGYATQVSAYAAASHANLKLVPLPTVSKGSKDWNFFKPGMYWSVSSQSKHPAEAALLTNFFLNDSGAAKILGSERGIPAVKTSLEAIKPSLTPDEVKAVDFTQAEASSLGSAPQVAPAGSSTANATLLRYAQQVYAGQQGAEDAAKAFIKEVQASIDAAKK